MLIHCQNRIKRMIDNKNMSVDINVSTSKKMNGVEWRMKWKEYLKESILNDNKNCMLIMNVDKGEIRGVCKREEVIENLPSLISIQFDQHAFLRCYSIVFQNLSLLNEL